jgi:uncharacterized membrane protein YdjX (TVP38/TMEM64 family)
MAPGARSVGLKRDIARVVIMVLVFAGVAYALTLPAVREQIDVGKIRGWAQGHGWHGTLFFIVLSSCLTGIGIPRLWISTAAGAIFGAALGTVIGHFSSMLGATLNFYIARFVLRGPIERHMPARVRIWYDRFNENGFRWLLYMRLFPLSNATFTNTVGGISRMSYGQFFAATFIGYTPLTLVFALFGSSAAKHNYWQLAFGGIIFVSVLVGRSLYERWRGRVTGVEEPVGEETA